MFFQDFRHFLTQQPRLTIAVVGDIMIDQYIQGVVKRMAPESTALHPVPILSETTSHPILGGTSFVARILADLGVETHLCGVVGDDATAIMARQIAQSHNIHCGGGFTDNTRPTSLKQRYQPNTTDIMLRGGDEKTHPISDDIATSIGNYLSSIPNLSAIIVSDYGKGVVTDHLMNFVRDVAAAKQIPVLIDPKGSDWHKYRGADVITPNKRELEDVARAPIPDDNIMSTARALLKQHDLKSILVTRSEDGMDLITPTNHVHHDSLVTKVITVINAGDHVIASLACDYALKTDAKQALQNASKLAAYRIEGHDQPHIETSSVIDFKHGNNDWNSAKRQITEWQKLGLKVGFTNGCFDILHAGHVMYLNQAKQYCDRLVLGLNSDASVRILKGPTRPINNEQDRKDVMMGLKAIDHVVFFGAENAGDDNTPTDVITYLKPDIFFKGGDYTIDQLPEAKAVLAYGGEVKILGLLDGRSTTNIIAKSQKI